MSEDFQHIREELGELWSKSKLSKEFDFIAVSSTTSSMDLAKSYFADPQFHIENGIQIRRTAEFNTSLPCSKSAIVAAYEQTAGRGTKGRAWRSDAGKGIFVTYAWEFNSIPNINGLSLSVGLAVVSFCKKLGIDVELKWPNDVVILSNNVLSKLAGILVESSSQSDSVFQCYIGVGINIRKQVFPKEISGISLEELSPAVADKSYSHLLELLSYEIAAYISSFFKDGFPPLLQEYVANCAHIGKLLRIDQRPGLYLNTGVAEDGSLLLLDKDTGLTLNLYSGAISWQIV